MPQAAPSSFSSNNSRVQIVLIEYLLRYLHTQLFAQSQELRMHQLRPWASSKDWCQLWPSLERLWVVWLILVIETIWTLNSNITCQAMFITALGISDGLETPTTFIITSSGADRFYPLRYFYSPCLPLKMVNKYWQNPSGQSRDTWVEHRSGRKKWKQVSC